MRRARAEAPAHQTKAGVERSLEQYSAGAPGQLVVAIPSRKMKRDKLRLDL